jgi:hypothetical protein
MDSSMIPRLLNSAVSTTDAVQRGMMSEDLHEWWIVKDLEKADRGGGVIKFTIPALHRRNWVKSRKHWLVPIQSDYSHTEKL